MNLLFRPIIFVLVLNVNFGFTKAQDLRRIALDGTEGVFAPAAQLANKEGLIYLIHNVPVPMLELFPTDKKPSRGTIIICPGGGYRSLAITHEGYNVAKKLNDFGFDAAVLLYHLRADNEPKQEAWDLALSNAKAALTLLQKRGAEFGLSTKKTGIIGFSAGGHLAARLAYATAESSPPDFLAMIYPGNGGKVVTDVDFAPGTTPTFLYVAADDTNPVANCIAYDAACKVKKMHCELHIAQSGGHGFGLRESLSPNVKDWPDKLKIFIDGLGL